MREKRKYQASKSTSNKRLRRKRDILLGLPHSEFLGIASTFSGLVLSLLFGITIYNNTHASSISVSVSGDMNLDLLASNDGMFGTSSASNISVRSTNAAGYTLTLTGDHPEGKLVGASNDHYFTNIGNSLTREQFDTVANNGKWGIFPSKHQGVANTTNYYPAPTSITPVNIDTTNSANNTPNTYTLAIAARAVTGADTHTPTDTYSGTMTLAATGNAIDYDIAYVDAAFDMPELAHGASTNGQVTLSDEVPKRRGYTFIEWCSKEVAVDATCASVSGTSYSPGASYTLSSDGDNNVNLYAVWATNLYGITTMQEMTASICNATTTPAGSATQIDTTGLHTGDTSYVPRVTLIDTRDHNAYLVSKLADGHCWMSQNLTLELTAGTPVKAYDFSSTTGDGTFDYNPQNTTQTALNIPWKENAEDGAQSLNIDKNNYIGGADITVAGTVSNTGEPYEKIGILYNWAAATAQTGEQAAAAGSSGMQVIPTSICPKGWRLPAYSGDYSFSTLMGSYGLPTTHQDQGYSGQLQNPLNFNRPGFCNSSDGALSARGTRGYFWSSLGYSATDARYLVFDSRYFDPQGGYYKGNGLSVRCVAV